MGRAMKRLLRRWLARLGLGVGVTLLLAAGVWGWLQYDSARKLQAVIDAAHARGEPILRADFAPPSLPDAGNSAPLLREAAGPLVTLDERECDVLLSPTGRSVGMTDAEADDLIESVLADHPDVLRLLAAARQKAGVAWTVTPDTPIMTTDLPHLNDCRFLVEFAANVARHRHRRGEDAAAVRRLRDAAFVCRAADASPLLVSHLAAVGCDALVADAAREIASTLKVGSAGASAGEVRALIADLTDEAGRRAEFHRALLEEKLAVLDSIEGSRRGAGGGGTMNFLWRYNAVHAAEGLDAVLTAAGESNWPAASAVLKPWVIESRPPRLHAVGDLLMPGWAKFVKTDFKAAAARRVAATALAIRLFQADHGGNPPATLADLVPDYLPALPVDRFAPDGRAFGYAAGGPSARLWSVGINGVDEGGAPPVGKPPGRAEGGAPWDFPDAVFRLDAAPESGR